MGCAFAQLKTSALVPYEAWLAYNDKHLGHLPFGLLQCILCGVASEDGSGTSAGGK